jgi:signal transduction histidine kinase
LRIFIFIIVLLSSISLNANAYNISDSTEIIRLDEETYFHKTKNELLEITDLMDVDWTKSNQGGNFGLVRSIYWLKYEFNNSSNSEKELYLFSPYNYVNYLDIYQVIDGKANLLSKLGTVRSKKNNGRVSRGWVTKINFPQKKSIIIVRAKNLYAPLRVNSFILQEKILDETIVDSYSLLWFWKGLFIFAMTISLVLFYFLRFRLFIYYFLFNLGLFIFLGVDFGDLNFLFIDNPNNRAVDIQRVANIIVLIFFPLFLNELTPIKKYNPGLWKIMKIGYYAFGVLWFINLFPVVKVSIFYLFSSYFFMSFTLFIIMLQIYFLTRASIDNEKNSKALLILYTIFIGALILNAYSQTFGFSKDNLFVYNSVLLSSIFQVVTFLFLIGYDLSSVFRERNHLVQKQSSHELELIKAVINSQESERNIVGRELHDMIGANLSVIKQNTNKSNFKLVKLIDDTIDGIRSLSHGLITPNIEFDNFEEEVHDLLSMFETETMKVKYYFHKWPILNNTVTANHLYRIIQELLQNALKHSEATEVYIQFLNHEANLSVMYEDNGKGFDIHNRTKFGRGIINLESRTSLIGGTINYDSTNTGTSINIELKNL